MRKPMTLGTFLLATFLGLHASADGLPVRYQQRPLTLPRGELSIDASYTYGQFTIVDVSDTTIVSFMGVDLGGAYGITEDLQVDASVLPLQLDPEVAYEDPSFGAVYRLLRGDFELGVGLHMILPIAEESDFTMPLSVPMLVRIGRSARLDTGLIISLVFGGEFTTVLGIPVGLMFQATKGLYLGPVTGLYASEFDLGKWGVSPLGAVIGYSIAGRSGHALLDIVGEFHFPLMFSWGSQYTDTISVDDWAATLGVAVHLGIAE